MLDITKAGMTQLTYADGSLGEWSVNLDGKDLFTLSKTYSIEQMFEIRDTIKKMMDYANEEGKNEANQLAKVMLDRVVEHGDAKLDTLKAENERLSLALEKIIISEEN